MGRRGDGGGVGEILALVDGLRYLCRAGVCGYVYMVTWCLGRENEMD